MDAREVGLRGDTPGSERRDHGIPVGVRRQLHHEDEPAAPRIALVLAGQDEVVVVLLAGGLGAELGEALAVEGRDFLPGIQQLPEPLDLGDADRGLKVAEPVVEADPVVLDL